MRFCDCVRREVSDSSPECTRAALRPPHVCHRTTDRNERSAQWPADCRAALPVRFPGMRDPERLGGRRALA